MQTSEQVTSGHRQRTRSHLHQGSIWTVSAGKASSYERLVEMPREQIVGKYDYQLFPEASPSRPVTPTSRVLASGRSIAV